MFYPNQKGLLDIDQNLHQGKRRKKSMKKLLNPFTGKEDYR